MHKLALGPIHSLIFPVLQVKTSPCPCSSPPAPSFCSVRLPQQCWTYLASELFL
ncbi:unnamed protein product [Nyctereutes procyonoides]|uniref:(raccoon dog) hypothetical protein n=1 Tax=Nyctereutes procyonoides TaxID=34880 RepID=A0A811ZSH6_NYCPR|nr:unnamed protein product [Nyctereutes procyonoides]